MAVPDLPQGQLGPGPGPENKGGPKSRREKQKEKKEKKRKNKKERKKKKRIKKVNKERRILNWINNCEIMLPPHYVKLENPGVIRLFKNLY